jgi:hypothetical protein
MSKYEPLSHTLQAQSQTSWRASFAEIERVLNFRLPISARKYPAWWSNDPQSHSQTRAWLSVGWKTAQVDIPGEKVTFMRNHETKTKHRDADLTKPLPPTILTAIPQWMHAELYTQAKAEKLSVEKVLVQTLERGLAAKENAYATKARALRALAPKAVNVDLDALIRQGRAAH